MNCHMNAIINQKMSKLLTTYFFLVRVPPGLMSRFGSRVLMSGGLKQTLFFPKHCLQSWGFYLFLNDIPNRLPPSKLPKCRDFRVSHPSCALGMTKMLLFIVFPFISRLWSYQSVAIHRVPPSAQVAFSAFEVGKVSLFIVFPSLPR